ncbi:hypothetical protein ME1_01429 [Bartonella vinsonii subsp. arupensis OK-94-513]|uniref:Uncharacterized protein n=2 Tax=Bartonella vinsonii subsp. arupensis TaxID=110578 RepID=J1JMA5_BARVI|nr:hypothetical protein [Bartonella vinsonii]EJF85852.1 hypothetical protein ME1_01429 [Bartonella vinsonii subsp. arupensis OK-94-513]EJF98009.1 hypothetical protein MEI_01041 [Bartonella vinsonii subsp. arupensis Pm136co]
MRESYIFLLSVSLDGFLLSAEVWLVVSIFEGKFTCASGDVLGVTFGVEEVVFSTRLTLGLGCPLLLQAFLLLFFFIDKRGKKVLMKKFRF